MCRFLAYQGPAVLVEDLLYTPEHSLVKQSHEADEPDRPLNADGFGLGWYTPEITSEPARIVSVTPAWNNLNLRSLAAHLRTSTVLAHVRRASTGAPTPTNCHPFRYNNLLMMHNGYVEEFGRIKRRLLHGLTDARFDWIDGQTDSQHLFAIFLDHYRSQSARTVTAMKEALRNMFADLVRLKQEANLKQPSYLNMVISDGKHMIASRFTDSVSVTPLSLYRCTGTKYQCDDKNCRMMRDDDAAQKSAANLIASEPLNRQDPSWEEVPPNHFVLVEEGRSACVEPINTHT